jgi:hypothetical protein
MRVNMPMSDVIHHGRANPDMPSDGRLAVSVGNHGPDQCDYIVRDLAIPPASARLVTAASSLTDHVAHVVQVGAKEQVRWIAASSVIASVAHEHAIRYRSVGYSPRNPVRPEVLMVHLESTVSVMADPVGPGPAGILWANREHGQESDGR